MNPLTPGGRLPRAQVSRLQARGKTLCSPQLTSVNYNDQAESFSTKAAYTRYRSQFILQQCPTAGLEPSMQATSGSTQATTELPRPGLIFVAVYMLHLNLNQLPFCNTKLPARYRSIKVHNQFTTSQKPCQTL